MNSYNPTEKRQQSLWGALAEVDPEDLRKTVAKFESEIRKDPMARRIESSRLYSGQCPPLKRI